MYAPDSHFTGLILLRRISASSRAGITASSTDTTASSSVYTYGPGEHAVERPAEDKPAASTLQTICASNLTNAQAMAVFSLAIQLQLVAMRLYWAEFSDAEMAHQNIEVGPITQGDAKAVLDKLSAVGAKGTAQAA